MLLNLTDLSPEPLQSQIYRQIRARILSGALAESSSLPAVATMARDHRVASTSVQRAYEELVGEGLVAQRGDEFEVCELSEANRQELARQRLFESLREQELSVKELELARDIQCRLLPPARVAGRGYVVGSRNDPARFVAGDFYDVLRYGDGSVGVVVADVAGKGLGPSLIMASVKAVMPFVSADRSVSAVLAELNQKLHRELRKREFVAMVFARFEPSSGRLTLANAGMPDAYLLRSNGGICSVAVEGERLPLGMRAEVPYQETEVMLEEGDRLLMLSDGLPEAPVTGGEPLGYRRFERLLGRVRADEPDLWIDELMDQLRRQHASDRAREDDWTALLLERRAAERLPGEDASAGGDRVGGDAQ